MRNKIILLFLIFRISSGLSQTPRPFKEEFRFAEHLINQKLYSEGIYLLDKLRSSNDYSPGKIDTINYLLGKIYYNQQKLATSSNYFSQVRTLNIKYWQESSFFSAFNQAYSGNYRMARKNLDSRYFKDEMMVQLKNFQSAGFALLNRNYQRFDSLSSQFQESYFQFAKQEGQLIEYFHDIKSYKKKSGFIAAMLSAVIPGSGKIYAGKTGQGLSNLFKSLILGGLVFESYKQAGTDSAKFIAFSSVFSIFYVANIWGSALTVKVKRNEFHDAVDRKILFDLHIPLRTIFH